MLVFECEKKPCSGYMGKKVLQCKVYRRPRYAIKRSECPNIDIKSQTKKGKIQMKLAYSPNEVCAAIGICRTKLYQHINAGKILARKDGRDTVILKEDLDNFLISLPPLIPRAQHKEEGGVT